MAEQLPSQEGMHRAGNLYAVDLLLAGDHPEHVIINYTVRQEATHIAEGIALMQRTVRRLPFVGKHIRAFGDKPMVEANTDGYKVAQKQYLKGDVAALGLARRRKHDISIAESTDTLMQSGKIGEGFMIASPYGEEWDDETAARMGQWPKHRRSYLWFYRKISKTELECVDVSVDQSSLATYTKLLRSLGQAIPDGVQSHDIPAFMTPFIAVDESARDALIDDVLARYKALNNDPAAKQVTDGFEAMAFIEKNAGNFLHFTAQVHKAVADSLRSQQLDPLARRSITSALTKLNCLEPSERASLVDLLHATVITSEHRPAFATLLTAQRYGIWQAVSDFVSGDLPVPKHSAATAYYAHRARNDIHEMQMLNTMYNSANKAAVSNAVMPGCEGGRSFLSQSEDSVKSSIFENKEASSKKQEMNCPFCSAKVFDDPCARILCCPDCRAMVVDGKVKSKGNGGSRARKAAKKALEAAEAERSGKVQAAVQSKPPLVVEKHTEQSVPEVQATVHLFDAHRQKLRPTLAVAQLAMANAA